MKTKPKDITLTQWMDGELEGEELHSVEAWAQEHPELLKERDAVHAMSMSIREHVEADVEPPYPDFFNQKILRAIEEEEVAVVTQEEKGVRGFWQWLTAPIAIPVAMVAMVLCFYLGTQVDNHPSAYDGPSMVAVPTSAGSVYTPDGAVSAVIFKSDKAEATVIVLEGLNDIPDDLEMAGGPSVVSEGTMMIHAEEVDRTF